MGKKEKTVVRHWADQIAEEVIDRVEKNKFLKSVVDKSGYFVYDEKTPSGSIHVGSGRGWIIHDAIAKALRERGKDAKFVLSSDDFDPLDKPSRELTEEQNKKYIGMPFRDIPSPKPGYKSFADYFFRESTDLFPKFGIEAELESTGEQYDKGVFNKQIKLALDNTDKIQKIYLDLYGEDAGFVNKLPFNVKCPKCGKIATTRAIEWDSKKEQVYFECKDDVVDWAEGCGYEGWISPYDGNGKLPWKVEWAAKWPGKGVIVETAGKDHFTKGGSRTVSNRIAVDVFDYPPPYPSQGYYTGKGYEFFTVGGKKMSTSKGKGIGFAESMEIAPPRMLRFLMVRTRPHAVIDFQPYDSNDLILLYERFDRAERIYFGKEDQGEKKNKKQKRSYELSHIDKIPERMPPQVPFTHAAILVQVYDDVEDIIRNLKDTEHLSEDVNEEELEYVKERLKYAKSWIEKSQDEKYKIKLQEDVSKDLELTENQKKSLHMIAEKLKEKKWKEQDLHNEFYKIFKEELKMSSGEFFQGAYKVLLNKERGPKLAGFVLAVKEKAIELFEKI